MGCKCCKIGDIENLKDKTYKDGKTFIPPIQQGKVVKVYDGDTITIINYLPYKGSELYRFRVRLRGIDCPEIRTKDKTEKRIAEIARDKLREKIMDKIVELENVNIDKYGRILADVKYNKKNMGDWLLENRLAIKYDGGKKTEIDWCKIYGK